MKTTFFIIITLAVIVYSGNPSIKLKPFQISFEKPYLPFAILFLILSVMFYTLQYTKIGYRQGVEDVIEQLKKNKD